MSPCTQPQKHRTIRVNKTCDNNYKFYCFRSFGRFTLVGTHTINSIHKFLNTPNKNSNTPCINNNNGIRNIVKGEFLSSDGNLTFKWELNLTFLVILFSDGNRIFGIFVQIQTPIYYPICDSSIPKMYFTFMLNGI